MNQTPPLGVILLLTFFLCVNIKYKTKVPTNKERLIKLPLAQVIEGRYQHEYNMTHDPKVGRIPSERLLQAKEYTNFLLSQKAPIPNIQWEERGPNNVSGRTRAILIDARDITGNTVFAAGVGGGLWKTTDAGLSWTPINDFFDNLAICAIAQDPLNPNHMYFGTGEGFYNADAIRGMGIFKSTDGGATFSFLASTDNPNFWVTNRLAFVHDGTTSTLVAGTWQGCFISSDGGNTWTNTLVGNIKDVQASVGNDLYAGSSHDGIYKSSDYGQNWTEVFDNNPSDGRIEIGTAPSDNNIVIALFEHTATGIPQIRRTIDGGVNWTDLTTPEFFDLSCTIPFGDWTRGQDWYNLCIAIDPNHPNRFFIGGIDLFGTQDGGNTWEQVSSWSGRCGRPYVHADQHVLTFVPGNSSKLYNGNDGGIFISQDAHTTRPDFAFRGNGYNVTQFYAADLHPSPGVNYFLAGSQDNGTQQFNTIGLNNTVLATGGDGAFCHIDQLTPDIQITSYVFNNFFISTDGGNTFEYRNFGFSGRFINPSEYDDVNKKLYSARGSGQYLRWNDPATAGSNLITVTANGVTGQFSAFKLSPNVNDRLYAGASGNLYRIEDASMDYIKTATPLFSLPGAYLSSIDIEAGNEDHILLTYSNYGVVSVYQSTNATSNTPTFIPIEGNLPDIPVRWGMINPTNPDQALLATELGVWSTDDINGPATQWAPTNQNLANVRVDMIKHRPSDHLVIAATHGRGLYSSSLLGSTCNDGIQNQGEEGVDCGGPCLPCTLCNDGILNQNETSIDCGGPCKPCDCTTLADLIYDGLINTGLDVRTKGQITISDNTNVIAADLIKLQANKSISFESNITINQGVQIEFSADDCQDTNIIIGQQ